MKPGDIAFKVYHIFVTALIYTLFQSNFGTYDKETNLVITRRADRVMEVTGPILAAAVHGMFATMLQLFFFISASQEIA